MRNRVRHVAVVSLLSALLLTASAFSLAYAAGNPPGAPPPNYITCQTLRLVNEGTGWWSNTANPNTFDQKLTVQLLVDRDAYNDAYCGQMRTLSTLVYRNVSNPGSVTATIVNTDNWPNTSQNDPEYQSPAGGSWQNVTADSQPFGITSCGYAFGQWKNSSILVGVRVPTSGSKCD